jgi:hypothetical protein
MVSPSRFELRIFVLAWVAEIPKAELPTKTFKDPKTLVPD